LQRGGKECVHAESLCSVHYWVVRREGGTDDASSERPRQIVGELVGGKVKGKDGWLAYAADEPAPAPVAPERIGDGLNPLKVR
jgi:hypothetical protein